MATICFLLSRLKINKSGAQVNPVEWQHRTQRLEAGWEQRITFSLMREQCPSPGTDNKGFHYPQALTARV